jgi:D-apionate oxidoisomerase
MGYRVARKLAEAGHDMRAIEIGEAGRARLTEAGIRPMDQAEGLAGPRRGRAGPARQHHRQGRHRHRAATGPRHDGADPRCRGTLCRCLPKDRPDLTYFVGHPCHPPLYNDETDWAARRDYHGGVAKQAIVCALMQGPEEHYALGVEICQAMWSPVTRVHRVTVEQLAILEPGLSEMVAMAMVDVMSLAVDECATKYGIDREAAQDFLIGHLNVEIAMWFGFSPKVPSDAAVLVQEFGKQLIMKDNWREVSAPRWCARGRT